jgi:ankyrin repeat protein
MFPVPAPGNLAPAPVPVPIQAPAQPPGNPAPQVNNVVVPDDPRGSKRGRENDPQDYDEPVLKQARTEPAAEQVDPTQQKLINAIESGDLPGLHKLLGQSRQLLSSYFPGVDGLTPLCLAARCGKKVIVGFLLSSGSRVDAPAKNGSTPLMFASQLGHVEMIRQLCLLGADLNAINPMNGWDALTWAVNSKQLDACKALIANGADMNRLLTVTNGTPDRNLSITPLRHAIAADFVELIDWWLDVRQRNVDSIEPTSSTSLLNLAVSYGALTVVPSLLQRGANPDSVVMITPDNMRAIGVWQVAAQFRRFAMIEYLFSIGLMPKLFASPNSLLCAYLGIGPGTDLCIHLGTKTDANIPADRLTNSQLRQHPERAIDGLAERYFASSNAEWFSALGWWCDQGLLSIMLSNQAVLAESFVNSARLLGQNAFPSERFSSITGATQAQQSQILVEFLSNVLCSPEWPLCFSGLKLTPKGEQTMNQIAVAQGELLLKGVANLREQFEKQVASLPSLCINSYITLSHQINESDLYRKMTREWGLYDPVARAAIRLVKEAYEKLRALPPQRIPAEFAAMSPSEQLRYVMVDLLEDWDKIPELVETLLKCDAQALDVVSDLLFQQWRLFGEAFGVTKPRYSLVGPYRPEAEPVMEVDEGHPTTRAPVPLTPQ